MTSTHRSCSRRIRGRRLLAAIASLPLGIALGAGSLDYRSLADAAPTPVEARGPATPAELEAFIDGFMASRMTTAKIAGATVAVVKDGEPFFAKGYGYADVDARVPVDPQRTLFRIASISKLFTWTAVMQLVEEGRLDLDTDVNAYLSDFEIPATFGEPITLRNLMTHTSGLDDTTYFYPTPNKHEMSAGEWLARHLPPRVRPPTTDFSSGTNAAYSNTGATLAGHIVEQVSGLSFDDYVEQRILTPLGMHSSSSREPLPEPLAARMSAGYLPGAGGFVRGDFETVKPMAPAGSISATAADMGRFMLAFLNEGELDGARILAPQTVHRMLTRTLSPDPAVNGTALGFYENYINGRLVIGHGGDTQYFHSSMSLLPEANLGLFAAVNTGADAGWVAEELLRAFVQHYFPARLPQVEPPANAAQRNVRYVGTYRTLGHTYTTYEKIFSGFDDAEVMALPDGKLQFADPLEGSVYRWVEVGEGVFRVENDDIFVAFKGDAGGLATHLVGPFAPTASERIQWYDKLSFHIAILLVAAALLATVAVSAVRHRAADRAALQLRWARPVLALAGVLLVAAVLGLAAHFSLMQGAALLRFALTLALLAVVPALAAVVFAMLSWKASAWSLRQRLHYSAATLAALAFLWVLHYWNLLGYHFG